MLEGTATAPARSRTLRVFSTTNSERASPAALTTTATCALRPTPRPVGPPAATYARKANAMDKCRPR